MFINNHITTTSMTMNAMNVSKKQMNVKKEVDSPNGIK